MKILLAHPYVQMSGGAEKYFLELAKNLTSLGNEVTFFCLEKSTQKHNFNVVSGIGKKFLRYDLPTKQDLQKIIALKPDLIHVNSPLPFSSYLAFKLKSSNIPIVSTYQAHINPSNLIIKLAGLFERNLYRYLFKKIIVTSHFYKKEVAKFYPESMIQAIPLGINLPSSNIQFKASPSSRKILFVGAMDQNHYYKGVEFLIQAAKNLPDFTFTFIGDGNQRKYYQSISAKLKNCVFLGKVDDSELINNYKKSDILVLPSTTNSEGYGLVLLESLSYATPVITTSAVGSAQEIKRNGCGIIVEPRSAQEIEKAINQLYNNNDLYKNLSKNGLDFTSKLSWKETAEKTLEFYAHTIKAKS